MQLNIEPLLKRIVYLLGGYILLAQIIKSTNNYINLLPKKIAITLLIIICFIWFTLILFTNSEKFKWKKLPIKKMGLKNHLFFLGSILGLLVSILTSNDTYYDDSFVFESNNKYNVLLLPFSPDINCKILETNLENSLVERYNKKRREDLDELDFHFHESHPCPGDVFDVAKILKTSKADMVIWGSYEEDCNEPNKVRLRYLAFNDVDTTINLGDTEMQDLGSLRQLRQGYLQKDIDEIIYTTIGFSKYNNRQYQSAIDYLKKANLDDCTRAKLLIGEAYLKLFKVNEAFEYFQSMNDTCDYSYSMIKLYNIAECYRFDKIYLKADIAFQECIDLNPELPDCYFGKALNAYSNKELNKAIENFKKAIQLNSSRKMAYLYLAEIYYEKKLFELEFDILRKGVKKFPEEYKINYNLGLKYEFKGNLDSALIYYSKAVDLNPTNQLAKYAFGILYRKLEKYEQSIEVLEALIKENPDSIKYRKEIIYSYYYGFQYKKTIKTADKILKNDSSYLDAYIYKGYALNETGEFSKAFDVMMEAYTINPNNKNVKDFFKESIIKKK